MWLADFINKVVAKRKRPGHGEGKVVMKIDVEGKELDILPDILVSGAIQHIDNMFVEFHPKMGNDIVKLIESMEFFNRIMIEKKFNHSIEITKLDDETYYTWNGEYPKC